ncbi:hypothetical protein WMY93_033644 [Mugilogobius chulae]|uniref:LIM zinc-binding domain-containing protein n=1 Tax=Mugilogobius chulae TaxID=88201 RepID=A0AAW0MT65_9GOBI
MNPPCARCGKTVYPTEKVNCLDKSHLRQRALWAASGQEVKGQRQSECRCGAREKNGFDRADKTLLVLVSISSKNNWHKGCFHCEVCKMTLNMKTTKATTRSPTAARESDALPHVFELCQCFCGEEETRKATLPNSRWVLKILYNPLKSVCSEEKKVHNKYHSTMNVQDGCLRPG